MKSMRQLSINNTDNEFNIDTIRTNQTLHYRIRFPEAGRPEGIVGAEMFKAHKCNKSVRYYPLVRNLLARKRLAKDDKVAYIPEFYPNGNPDEDGKERVRRFSRKGIGSRIMSILLEDLNAAEVKVAMLYAVNGSSRFYEKMGFEQFNGLMYYRPV